MWKRIVEKIVSWIGVPGKIPGPFKGTCGIVKKLLMELRLFRRVALDKSEGSVKDKLSLSMPEQSFAAFAKDGAHPFFHSSAFQ